jgi:[ribosomal protein S5]-alanine N-acetyltransferase
MYFNIPEKIETERLMLRKLRYEDAAQIFYVYASKLESTRYVYWRTHETMEDTREFLKKAHALWSKRRRFCFGIFLKASGRMVGEFALHTEGFTPQISYLFGPIHWGKGYAQETCGAVMRMLKQVSHIHKVETFVDIDNSASKNVLIKCGFVEFSFSGKFPFVNQGNQPKACSLFVKILQEIPLENQGEK